MRIKLIMAALAFCAGLSVAGTYDRPDDVRSATAQLEGSTVARVAVPAGLHCEEDEVITFTGNGDNVIGCVHVDLIVKGDE